MNSLTPQQSEILGLLRDAGTNGINSFGRAREISIQLPAVVAQLIKHGYSIKTRRHRNRSVTYYLLHTPIDLRQAAVMIMRPQGWVPDAQPIEEQPEHILSLQELSTKIEHVMTEFFAARDAGASALDLELIKRRGVALRNAQTLQLKRQQLKAP